MVKKLLGAAALLCALISTTAAQAQSYCTPVIDDPQGSYDVGECWITGFSTSGATVNITNVSGYNSGFVAGQSCTAAKGAIVGYTMQLQASYQRGIWIDWNHDYDFNDAGEEILFDDASMYAWGEGKTSSGNITVPGDAVTGTTRLRLRIGQGNMYGDMNACNDTYFGEYEDYNFTVTAPTAGTTTITSGNATNCGSADVTLTATGYTSGNGISLQWQSFTNGVYTDIPGATNDSYTATDLTESTSYTLYVTCASSAITSQSNTVNIIVNRQEEPTITLYKPATICYLSQSIFTVTGTDLGEEPVYTWFRNSVEIEGATEASYTTSDISKYADEIIAVTVSNINGECISGAELSASETVRALSPLDPNVTYTTTSGSTKLCEGDAVTFLSKSAAAPNAVFSWSRDGVLIDGENGSSYTTDQPGAITATATSEEGCTRTTTSPRVINVRPEATISENSANGGGSGLAVSTGFCTGSFINLYANTNVTDATYRWKLGSTNKGVATSQKVTVAGDYSVTVTKNGCAGTSGIYPVTEKTTDVMVAASGDLNFCTPGTVRLDAAENNGYTYQWYKSTAQIMGETNSSYTTDASGSYSVAVKNGSCPERKSAVIKTVATVTPVASINFLTKKPTYWTLRASPTTTGHTYQWYRNDTLIADSVRRDLVVSRNGNYTVIATKGMCSSVMSAAYPVNANFTAPTSRSIAGIDAGEAQINIFPNPSTGIFNIGSEEPVNVVVKDVQGRVVMDVRNASSIDLTGQAQGMYMMSITDAIGKLLQVERVVKQ
jgi:hypothetical protein